MNFTSPPLQLETPVTGVLPRIKERGDESAKRRRRALKRVDSELAKGNLKTALSLVKQLQGKPGGLRGFGAAKQVPKKQSTLDNFEFNGNNLSSLRLLVDSVCSSIQTCILQQQVSREEIGSLMCNESIHSSFEDYHFLCAQHEAGHFLVGYLLGVLPQDYIVPSVEELRTDDYAIGRVRFVGFDFLHEVGAAKMLPKNITKGEINKGKISSKTLNRFLCIILGGLVAEHLAFGYCEGLHADVDKLDRVFKWLGFTDSESRFQVRWAALNTIYILHRHREATSRLVVAMASGKSVGYCFDTIENAIYGNEI
ncbi:hypothetical protein CFOL_v3_06754 [Cephalotus follicularis]|uniref:Peptidase_M41 domain-containing protein n=1 Tax=Cephalotus follicularis TaxID=3775 RepID=A0A1Q3B5T7_CEPFO|nr:hypothetical protein CFOL_v3_06754 [Cephalotus follicularis]